MDNQPTATNTANNTRRFRFISAALIVVALLLGLGTIVLGGGRSVTGLNERVDEIIALLNQGRCSDVNQQFAGGENVVDCETFDRFLGDERNIENISTFILDDGAAPANGISELRIVNIEQGYQLDLRLSLTDSNADGWQVRDAEINLFD